LILLYVIAIVAGIYEGETKRDL